MLRFMTPAKDRHSDATDAALWRLLHAIVEEDEQTAMHLLESSPDLARKAIQRGATREISQPFFLDAIKRQVYARDTALHIAAAGYRADIAASLIARGADPRAKNRRGAEPLHYAAVGAPGSSYWNPKAQSRIIEHLIRAGADPNALDKGGVTPLHRAVRTRCAEAVRTLLAHGADAHRGNTNGSTPLQLAMQTTGRGGSGTEVARQQQAEIIQLLTSAVLG
jgi:ankyrin repeat protein